MPTLEWIGKDKVINHHQEVPFRVLERRYSYDEAGQHDEDNSSENMIIRGDNLEALKALLPRYEGRVKCIYIDPPYNTGNEGWVYNDNVNDPRIKKWLGEVVGKEGEDLTRHDKWLCMMYPRLKLLQKLLAEDGAIFISIDDNEQSNLKLICDEIFGSNCFITDVIWRSSDNSNNNALKFSEDFNYTLVYAKQPNWKPNFINDPSKRKHFKNPDNDPRGPWFDGNPVNNPGWRPNLQFDITAPNGNIIKHPQNGWRWSMDTIQKKLATGELRFSDDQTRLIRRTYLYEMGGLTPSNLWIDLEVTGHTRRAKYDLKKIFPEIKVTDLFSTPKPSLLIEYILQLASDPDSIILDSFAGSGTTAHAVLNMNKADGGHRKFILVEMMDYADDITAERVKRVIQGYGEGKKAVEGTGGSFSFYDLGEPLLIGECLNESVGTEKIREYIWFMETKAPYAPAAGENPYYLGTCNDTGYYFYYEPEQVTVLDYRFLSTVTEKSGSTVIYADRCSIGADKLAQIGIVFKKIPRDISRL
ncbi:MAG TPA: site-specific DNA-methyltransferase [Firmicutes bacterium]|nr:site-specific DNA-methyltransferase [Bacillota bacterium]